MPQPLVPAEISQLFLSATAQDCREYREAVRDFVLEHLPSAKISLQEEWAEGGKFVADVCKRKVHACDGYFGLFGHRYGWVPPGHEHSMTELEFRWAAERWCGREAPIFVLQPVLGSEADLHLKEQAKLLHDRLSPEEAARDQASQLRFWEAVRSWARGRVLVLYRDRLQLVGKALSCVQNWNLELLRKAAEGRGGGRSRDIPADELGRIGRESQLRALSRALDAHRERLNEPAAAFLVHGSEHHGQREFAELLAHWDEEWEGVEVHCGEPSELDDSSALIAWACSCLNVPVLGELNVDALASALSGRLRERSVVFVLRTLGRAPARLVTFQRQLWQPLLAALSSQAQGRVGRLYWFVIDHQPFAQSAADFAVHAAPLDEADLDYEKLLILPELTALTARDVREWLKQLKKSVGISLPEPRRLALADAATMSERDGLPAHVYNRLMLQGFWSAMDQGAKG